MRPCYHQVLAGIPWLDKAMLLVTNEGLWPFTSDNTKRKREKQRVKCRKATKLAQAILAYKSEPPTCDRVRKLPDLLRRISWHGLDHRQLPLPKCKRITVRASYLTKQDYSRRFWLFKQYLMTQGDYQIRLEAQEGVCAICRQPPTERYLHIDHDHATGKIRGLLCGPCNIGLGAFRDKPAFLTDAAAYLDLQVPTHGVPT